jgi:hypothetical protein
MKATKDARLALSGIALVLVSIVLVVLQPTGSVGAFLLAFGFGMCASARAVSRSARVHITVLATGFVGFVGYRLGMLVADGATATTVFALVAEALALATAYALAYEHAHGLAQLAALFRGEQMGYASVLDEAAAAHAVEAELARSRRHGTPLTFLLIEPPARPTAPDVTAVIDRLSPSAQSELQQAYARQRACGLIAEHVRRSDVVVCAQDRFVVISSDTSSEGTQVLATRMVEASLEQLGLQLRTGVAAFPTNGTTYEELLEAATASALGPEAGSPPPVDLTERSGLAPAAQRDYDPDYDPYDTTRPPAEATP